MVISNIGPREPQNQRSTMTEQPFVDIQIRRARKSRKARKTVRLCLTDPRNGRMKGRLGSSDVESWGQVEVHVAYDATVAKVLDLIADSIQRKIGKCNTWHPSLAQGDVILCYLNEYGDELGHRPIGRDDEIDFGLGADSPVDPAKWVVKS